jgi:hypothetical protein
MDFVVVLNLQPLLHGAHRARLYCRQSWRSPADACRSGFDAQFGSHVTLNFCLSSGILSACLCASMSGGYEETDLIGV